MSMVSESQPACAMVSAEKTLGMASQPFTTASPRPHSVPTLFSRMAAPSLSLSGAGLAGPGGRIEQIAGKAGSSAP